ncbi:hypothetical protein BS17DRAFT_252895 [Gyrodon lividus]|nr:hypothetical protein BS17DRAFT_252895 [Gyrodon lividus]
MKEKTKPSILLKGTASAVCHEIGEFIPIIVTECLGIVFIIARYPTSRLPHSLLHELESSINDFIPHLWWDSFDTLHEVYSFVAPEILLEHFACDICLPFLVSGHSLLALSTWRDDLEVRVSERNGDEKHTAAPANESAAFGWPYLLPFSPVSIGMSIVP